MIAWRIYQESLCPGGCGQPREKAWHPDMDGWYEVDEPITCHACTALRRERAEGGEFKPVEFDAVRDTRDHAAKPLPPLPPPTTATRP